MYIPASLIAAAIIVIVLAAIALAAYARNRGYNTGSEEYRQLIESKNESINTLLYESVQARNADAEAMEEVLAQHQRECARMQDEAAGKLRAARATALSLAEIQLLQSMTGKLRLASPAFHARQQFADARKARELAARGETLVRRLLPDDEARENAA